MWETVSHSKDLKSWINGIYQNKTDLESVDPFFGGVQRNVVRCGECGNESTKMERFTEIPLSMERREDMDSNENEKGLSTKQMILDHFAAEKLEGDNMYFCSECGRKVVAQRTIEIAHAPKHLILCFKRFSWNLQTMKRTKRNEVCGVMMRHDV